MEQNFDPTKEPSRRLTIAYVIALVIIATFTIGSHFFITNITTAQQEMAEISYLAGKQRMLAQQIALYALHYNGLGREEDRQGAISHINDFESGHRKMALFFIQRGKKKKLKSQILYNIYFQEPYNLDTKAHLYIKKARQFLSYEYDEPVFERIAALNYIFGQAIGPFLEALDYATQAYQDEVLKEMQRLKRMQMRAIVFVLFVLLCEAGLIFWPLVKHIKSYSRHMIGLAMYDFLTGLHNRWAFIERAEGELSRAERHSRQYCLVVADIDDFKRINDTHGHDAGDLVLKHFAETMQDTFRAEDIIGRIGGEEFVVFFPETPQKGGMRAVERLRLTLSESPCDIGKGVRIEYTVSLGMAGNDEVEPISTEELMKIADTALYQSKRNGKNRLTCLSVDEEGPREQKQNLATA
ncbi:MAG: diguanylate cyclase [Proteobacteria bacterium]|nr:diguanylate cyclase [Pseudomonadota bacterium]